MFCFCRKKSAPRPWGGRPLILFIAILAIAAGLACSRGPDYVVRVPVKETAAEQFAFAEYSRAQSNYWLIDSDKDRKRYLKERHKVRQAYQSVVEHFPEDRKITPVARLYVANFDAGLDHPKHAPESRELRNKALEEYRRLLEEYPEYDYVQAKALYDMGMIYKSIGEFGKAQELFNEVRKRFADHSNEAIQYMVTRSNQLYNQIYVETD
mgnify:CR=1 FL=1